MERQSLSYIARAEPCEEGGYCVTFPDIPECITEGDTIKEAKEMAKDALNTYLSYIRNLGEELPKAKYKLRKDLKKIKQFKITADLVDII